MVLVQDLGRALDVELGAARNIPRQGGHPFQVGAGDAVFRRRGRHTREPVEFAHGLGQDFLLHPGGIDLTAQVIDLAGGIIALAEFLLNCFELLAQVELALVLGELSLDLRLNAGAQLHQFQFAGKMPVHLAQSFGSVEQFEQALPLGVIESGEVAGHEIGDAPGFLDSTGSGSELLGEIR